MWNTVMIKEFWIFFNKLPRYIELIKYDTLYRKIFVIFLIYMSNLNYRTRDQMLNKSLNDNNWKIDLIRKMTSLIYNKAKKLFNKFCHIVIFIEWMYMLSVVFLFRLYKSYFCLSKIKKIMFIKNILCKLQGIKPIIKENWVQNQI